MPDRENVIKGLEHCINHDGRACQSCPYVHRDCVDDLCADALALLKEQKKFVDVDALREKLGLAKDCAKCKQNTRKCQYDSHYSLMDFCERLDTAIEDLLLEGRRYRDGFKSRTGTCPVPGLQVLQQR